MVLIPALVRCDKHLEMMRVQSLLRERLRLHDRKRQFNIHTCVMFDDVLPEFMNDILSLDFSIKLFAHQLYPERPYCTGIRFPFEMGLRTVSKLLRQLAPTFVLRVIQDVVVDDVEQLLEALGALVENTRDFVAGDLATCDDIGGFLDELRIPRAPAYHFVQGALMFAPLQVWLQNYIHLPASISHYCDDSVVSQMVVRYGGELHRIPVCWRHLHDRPCEDSQSSFLEHSSEIQSLTVQSQQMPIAASKVSESAAWGEIERIEKPMRLDSNAQSVDN
jgi:hypothetical protein